MFTLRPTSMLAKRIGATIPAATVAVQTPHTDWCAHVFTAQRHRYLILTNTHSLLSVVTSGKGITTEGAFVRHSLAAIAEYFRSSGRQFVLDRLIAPAAAEVQLARLSDRAVMGSINELIFQAKLELIEGQLSASETSERLNEVPLSMLWKRRAGSCPTSAFDQMPATF